MEEDKGVMVLLMGNLRTVRVYWYTHKSKITAAVSSFPSHLQSTIPLNVRKACGPVIR